PDVSEVVPPPTLGVVFVARLAQALRSLGVAGHLVERIEVEVHAATATVPLAPIAEALSAIAREQRMPHLAIEIAKRMPPGSLGKSDSRFGASATLADAMAHVPSLVAAVTDSLKLEFHVEGDLIRVERVHSFRPTGVLTELGPCLGVRRLRDV